MRAVFAVACSALILSVLAACGGSSSPTGPSGGGTATTVTVAILGQRGASSYSPNPSAGGGRLVVWRNENGDIHNITSTDGSWETGDIAPGATGRAITIPAQGATYFCANHPDTMRGGRITGSGGETPTCTGIYCE